VFHWSFLSFSSFSRFSPFKTRPQVKLAHRSAADQVWRHHSIEWPLFPNNVQRIFSSFSNGFDVINVSRLTRDGGHSIPDARERHRPEVTHHSIPLHWLRLGVKLKIFVYLILLRSYSTISIWLEILVWGINFGFWGFSTLNVFPYKRNLQLNVPAWISVVWALMFFLRLLFGQCVRLKNEKLKTEKVRGSNIHLMHVRRRNDILSLP
jgi:hypothetical protein